MDIELALNYLGFIQTDYRTDYFRCYKWNNDTLFVFQKKGSDQKYFSNASGEFTGNVDDLICYYFLKNTANKYSEGERLRLFYDINTDRNLDLTPLIGLKSFNLFNVLLEKGKPYKTQSFQNTLLIDDLLHFLIVDEEKTNNPLNVLGVITYDLNSGISNSFEFSNLKRGIYFSNPNIRTDTCILVDDIGEMIYLDDNMDKSYFFIYVPSKLLSYNQARTINFLLKGKGINQVVLAFANSVQGLLLDFSYLSQFFKIDFKQKFASIKIEIPHNEYSDKLIQRMKDLREAVQKSTKKYNVTTDFISIKNGTSIKNESVFVIEIALIDNILKASLTLLKKYYFHQDSIMIIKSPDSVHFSDLEKAQLNSDILKKEINLGSIRNSYLFN